MPAEQVTMVPAIVSAQQLFGDPDYVLRVVAADLEAYRRIYDEQLAALPAVQRLSSTLVMKRPIQGRIDASRCYDADMAKVRTTLTIEDDVLRAVKLRAAQSGRGDSEVIEEALRRDLGLDFLERMWERATLAPQEADALAVEAQHATRGRRTSR